MFNIESNMELAYNFITGMLVSITQMIPFIIAMSIAFIFFDTINCIVHWDTIGRKRLERIKQKEP